MALNIKDPEAHALARELARLRETSLTEAVKSALREAVQRSRCRARPRLARLDGTSRHCASLPVPDDRSADEILGYEPGGMPS